MVSFVQTSTTGTRGEKMMAKFPRIFCGLFPPQDPRRADKNFREQRPFYDNTY